MASRTTPDPRTLRANPRVLKRLRKDAGLTHESAAEKSDQIVLAAARREQEAGITNGRFTRRVDKRLESGLSPGLSKGAIAQAERGAPCFITTMSILAMLYGKRVSELCNDEGEEPGDIVDSRSLQVGGGREPAASAQSSVEGMALPAAANGDDEVLVSVERNLEAMLELIKMSRRGPAGPVGNQSGRNGRGRPPRRLS